MKGIIRLGVVLGVALALVAPAANAATAAPAQSTTVVAQLPQSDSPVGTLDWVEGVPPGWVPWDGNLMTTLTTCTNRKNYLIRTYGLARSQIGCFAVYDDCGCLIGYIIYVNQNTAAQLGTRRSSRSMTP